MSMFSTRIDATGPRGNIFSILGAACQLMEQIGVAPHKITKLRADVAGSNHYSEAVAHVREWFPVDLEDEA